ncbi:unnamed protein product [Pedinophyceae sp. YPF-701]|nr:unnamed protein product [Pedinophyceae sp. YPF-701]
MNSQMLPGTALAGLTARFSLDGEHLAVLTDDGRLRLYDAAGDRPAANLASGNRKGGATANGHSAQEHTCLAWGAVQAKRGRSKKAANPSAHILAVGTSSGDVQAYDAAKQEPLWRARECNDGGVACLAYCHADGGMFLTCGPDASVCALEAATGNVAFRISAGKSAKLTCVAASPDGERVFAAASDVRVLSRDGTKTAKFSGHEAGVTAIAASPCGRYVFTSGRGDAQVAVWDAGAAKKKSRGKVLKLLDLPDAGAVALECAEVAKGAFVLCAVAAAGQAAAWACTSAGGELRCSPLVVVRVGGAQDKGKKAGAEDVVMAAHASGDNVLVARGSALRPSFQRVPIDTGDAGDSPRVVELPRQKGGALLPGKGGADVAADNKGRSLKPTGTVLGPDNLGEAVAVRPGGKRKARGDAAGDDAEPRGAEEMDVDADGADGQTLEERVAALELAAAGGVAPEAEGSPEGPATIKADSLVALLTQALRGGDKALLERCLSVGNEKIITNTARRLLPVDAAAFLKAALERLQTHPKRAPQLVSWIRATLLHHAGYLMTAPAAQAPLASLYQTIEARARHYRQLLALQGRLDLLVAQMPKAGQSHAATLEEAFGGPAPHFVDDASDGEGGAGEGSDEEEEEEEEEEAADGMAGGEEEETESDEELSEDADHDQ